MDCRDFTFGRYRLLLESLLGAGYRILPCRDYFLERPSGAEKIVCLRHDVDRIPERSLDVASLEHSLGVKASYYFRTVKASFDETVIRSVAGMGHEVGYHYESLTTCRGDVDAAFEDFRRNLSRLREMADVCTICMHGSPMSGYDSRDIFKKYDYRPLGIIGEPYLDIDWSEMFYLTDTGRRWDGFGVSLRDKIPGHQQEWMRSGLAFHSTKDIIDSLSGCRQPVFPSVVMIVTHPQRWCGSTGGWVKELLLQSVKNVVKRVVVRLHSGGV